MHRDPWPNSALLLLGFDLTLVLLLFFLFLDFLKTELCGAGTVAQKYY